MARAAIPWVSASRGIAAAKSLRAWWSLPLKLTPSDEDMIIVRQSGEVLPAGHYELTIRLAAQFDHRVLPLVHAFGQDRDIQSEAIRLAVDTARTRASARFILPVPTAGLRLTGGQVGAFAGVRLRRLSRAEFYGRLAGRALLRKRARAGLLPLATRAFGVLRRGGLKALAAELRRVGSGAEFRANDYAAWIAANEPSGPEEMAALRQRLAGIAAPPLISVLMPIYNTPETLLRAAIDSVRQQVYGHWQLCIADDGSTAPHIRPLLAALAATEPRLRVVFLGRNGGIAEASNAAFGLAEGAWLAMLDHDDLLAPDALAEVALLVAAQPDCVLVYSDEDKIEPSGERSEPYFKPDFSRELLRSQNYFNHLTVFRAETVRALGGWRKAFDGSQDYDLILRVVESVAPSQIRHIPKVLYHWRAVAGSVAADDGAKTYAHAAGLRALNAHIARLGLAAVASPAPETPHYRLRPALPVQAPKVSLIIPTRNQAALLRRCLNLIRDRTDYPDYEILVVDNGSDEPDAVRYLEGIAETPGTGVLRYDGPFNFSAINNFAVAQARGTIVGLINNDIQAISPLWLAEMVAWASQEDIGCVGAKLYYANDTIQHAGIVLGIGGVAGHSHKYFPRTHPGYFHRLKEVQNVSAVTGACLVVRKELYDAVGGLDAEHLAIAFNDVDFCLRVREAGYANVWTPYAELYHLESVSRGAEDNAEKVARFNREADYMRRRWDLTADPFYSPHLTREREDFSLAIGTVPAAQPGEGE